MICFSFYELCIAYKMRLFNFNMKTIYTFNMTLNREGRLFESDNFFTSLNILI